MHDRSRRLRPSLFVARFHLLDLIARSRYCREQFRSLGIVRANIETGYVETQDAYLGGKASHLLRPHYLGGDVVADNNADDHRPSQQ
jgi:hypothetical protein